LGTDSIPLAGLPPKSNLAPGIFKQASTCAWIYSFDQERTGLIVLFAQFLWEAKFLIFSKNPAFSQFLCANKAL